MVNGNPKPESPALKYVIIQEIKTLRGWLVTHDNCLDGATAALVGEACALTPIFVEPDRVEDGLRQVTDDLPVYLADVSLKLESWPQWKHRIAFLLDHHQSARPLAAEPNVRLDQSRSGAHLIYDFAVEQGWLEASSAWQRLCDEVERYDLWKPRHDAGQNLNRLFHKLGYPWYRERFQRGFTPYTRDEAQLLAELIREESAFVAAHLKTAIKYEKNLPFPIYGVELEEEGPVNIVCHTLIEQGAALVIVRKSENRLSARSDIRVDAADLMETLFHGGGHARAAGGRLPPDPSLALPQVLQQAATYLESRV